MQKSKEKALILSPEEIRGRIYTIRGRQVMPDSDLAELYNVEIRALNQAVKRNADRFPQEFMFQLTEGELNNLKSQIVTSNGGEKQGGNLKSQIVISSWGGRRTPPYAFTEQGVAMLSGVLKSHIAIKMSIQIINAFVAMRRFISANAQVFQRLDNVERKQIEHNKKFNELFDAIQSKGIKPDKGIFFNGQAFDAYNFVSDIVRAAEKSIILIDNYVDDSVLMLLSKRCKDVKAVVYTKEVSRQLMLDLEKHNSQYPSIEIREFGQAHDRFLIIDNKSVYHFGASLKDLGKKWFAFSKFEKEAIKLLGRLEA
ncbi:MAG: ORF6N domain-containing protein [Nanoarchaeota archaeon]|nr:ORF6N domain-containing protein [Nanoarchaeota archaeon]